MVLSLPVTGGHVRGYRHWWVFLPALIVVSACLASCTVESEPQEVLTLPARFADGAPQDSLEALDTYRDDQHFLVRYWRGNEVLYTGGDWASRIQLDSLEAGVG